MQTFRIVKPAPTLSPYIRYYWILRDDALTPVSERTLPVGCMQLVFHKGMQLLSLQNSQLQPQSFICGQSFGFSDVMSTGMIEMITVVFQPYAAKTFLRIPLHLFSDRISLRMKWKIRNSLIYPGESWILRIMTNASA